METKNNIKIAITGANGFIGLSLVTHLLSNDYKIIALTRTAISPKINHPNFDFHYLDLEAEYFSPLDFDIGIHIAAKTAAYGNWKSFEKTNIEATEKLIKAYPNCKYWIYISSASVYNTVTIKHSENEKFDLKLLSNYGKSKRLAEQIFQNSGKKCCILRPRAVY